MLTKFSRSSRHLLTPILIAELVGMCLLKWPRLYNFDRFAFWDWGAYLVAHYLTQQGKLPVTDFGWQYGLLPLLLQELWFHVLPAGPASFLILSFPCALVTTLAIGRFANQESRASGYALVIASLPFVVGFGDLSHYLEPTLLSVGLLLQAQRKRERSLAFATAACFTKPSMGYLYGLIVLSLIVADLKRQGRLKVTSLASALAPAAGTGLVLTVLLVAAFGWIPLISSLLPLTGARNYRLLHYGLGALLKLIDLPGLRLGYYIGTPVTFLVCATLYITASVAVVGWRALRDKTHAPGNYEIVFTCTLLHLGFLGFFYGSPASWFNYVYILVMGVVATDAWTRINSRIVTGLCVIATIANYSVFAASVEAWKTMQRSPVTAGLYASPSESKEWNYVASMVSKDKPVLYTWAGGAEVLFPWLPKPLGAFIEPGEATDSEIQHKVEQLRSAKTIIIPNIPGIGSPLTNWQGPEFKTVLDNTKVVFRGNYFEVYERTVADSSIAPKPQR